MQITVQIAAESPRPAECNGSMAGGQNSGDAALTA